MAVEFDLDLTSGRVHAQRFGEPDGPLVLAVPRPVGQHARLRLPCAPSRRRRLASGGRGRPARPRRKRTHSAGNLWTGIPRPRHVRGGNGSRPATVRLDRLVAGGLDRDRRGPAGTGPHPPLRHDRPRGQIRRECRRGSDRWPQSARSGPADRRSVCEGCRGREPDPAVHRLLASLLRIRVPPHQQGGLPGGRGRRRRARLAAVRGAT